MSLPGSVATLADRGYAPVTGPYTPEEAAAAERVMIAATMARDAKGLRLPIFIPPSVALQIVRAVRNGGAA